MAYIGNDLRSNEDYKIIDDISSGFNGSATSFALQVGGATPVPFPKFEQQLLISVNGVIQEPDPTGSAGFKLSGTNIVFSSAPTNGHAFFGVIYAGADYVNAGGAFPDGSINFPSITFGEDTNTGFTRVASGTVALISDGTKVAQFPTNQGSNGQALTTDGGGNLSFSTINTDLVSDTSPQLGGNLASNGNNINMADNDEIVIGSSNDLILRHIPGSRHEILGAASASLQVRCDNQQFLSENGNENLFKAIKDGAVELYHNNSKKFETNSTGSTLFCTGNGNNEGPKIEGSSSMPAILNFQADAGAANGDKCRFYGHQSGGSLLLQDFSAGSFQNMAKFNFGGSVELYHNNSKKLETTSNGISVGSVTIDSSFSNIGLPDGGQLRCGANEDLRIFHDGSDSHILNNTNRTMFRSAQIHFNNVGNTENMAKFVSDGAVELYYDNSKKFETSSTGVTITGKMSATTLAVDDNSDTSMDSSASGQLQVGGNGYTGAIALDGSNMNIYHNASGRGIVFGINETAVAKFDTSGNFLPATNNDKNLGSTSVRWANIYTNDLNLSNKGSSNDVDGSWGDWTIQEGESDLFLKNNRSGKKYKFNLTEVA